MNVALILAGGTGERVGLGTPKQFLIANGKPVIAYTIEAFEKNGNIDSIAVVCHRDWRAEMQRIVADNNFGKVRWICEGGATFQLSVLNGVQHLRNVLSDDDNLIISFGASPLTAQEDIDDAIRVCNERGNGIAAKDIDMCTCRIDGDGFSDTSVIRECIKGFANPWAFNFGELCDVYDKAAAQGILESLEPHTTSLYFAFGKRLYFSKSISPQVKITTKADFDFFKGYLLLKEKEQNDD